MKRALKYSLIYILIATGFYLALFLLPVPIAFYGMLLFMVVHTPGLALGALVTTVFAGQESLSELPHGIFYAVAIITNACLVFLIDRIRPPYS